MVDVDVLPMRGPATHAKPGQAVAWLRVQVEERQQGPECWEDWPFGRGSDGRPYAGTRRAYRYILEWRDGPANGRYGLHSCDNPRCWNPHHLRWGTPSENMQDAYDRGRMPEMERPRGEEHHNSKLTNRDMVEILTRHHAGESESSLAREFGISRSVISNARKGLTWAHIDAPRLTADQRGRNQFRQEARR